MYIIHILHYIIHKGKPPMCKIGKIEVLVSLDSETN